MDPQTQRVPSLNGWSQALIWGIQFTFGLQQFSLVYIFVNISQGRVFFASLFVLLKWVTDGLDHNIAAPG